MEYENLDDTWVINLRNMSKPKEKEMISKESKEFILKQQKERLSIIQGTIEHYQSCMAHYGKHMHDSLEEIRKIKKAIYDLENGADIPDEEDES